MLDSLRFSYANLYFVSNAIDLMVNQAFEMDTGARAVISICEEIDLKLMNYLRDHRQEFPFDKRIRVDASFLKTALDYKPK